MAFFIKKLAVIGVGLIGGSLARSLRDQSLVGEVVGVNRSRSALEKAEALGVIDYGTTDAIAAVRDASMVLIATPVRSIAPMVAHIAPFLAPGVVVTDVGSVKQSVVRDCEAAMAAAPAATSGKTHFVGGHPIAGREHVGVEHSFATLFAGSRTVLTPTAQTASDALELVRLVWEATGSYVEVMDAAYHDQVLAATSHLPHLMAYSVVNTLSDLEDQIRAEVFRYAAGGFRDFTRIASSDPSMWRDICLENRTAILSILERVRHDLDRLVEQIDSGNGDALYGIFARSKTTRDRILAEHKILKG
ncbi:MAG: prephenate dehydrogenase/arogenate dehydrogenase family protein [Magnetococcales bacterium]|nr:prephenate dehydrogenase/arogenate dehydrogenase family protein [Magnetococcales bacterium]MBF0115697.1 prephenate dehydrogenase/arogenate dehydrogenase family protein [Magnetococcales bacterium]